MREFKFRAWYDDTKTCGVFDAECNMFFVGDTHGTNATDCIRYKDEGQPVTLMQFTGLKDKNGVDIYEGDIISDHVGVGEVKYSDNRAAFRVVYGDGQAKWFLDYNLKGERESIEVIGNIYQNTELLK